MGWRRRISESGSVPKRALRAAFLELFFDLVFVFALARTVTRAFDDLVERPHGSAWSHALPEAGVSALLLLALLGLWQSTYWITSRHNPDSVVTQGAVAVALIAALVMGVLIPRAFEGYGIAFAIAYIVGRLTRPLVLGLTIQTELNRVLKRRMLAVYGITTPMWIIGAVIGGAGQAAFWALALTVEYAAARTGWPVPGLGRSDLEHWDITAEHLAERYQQLFLIALGETILAIGLSYSDTRFDLWHTAAFALAAFTTLLLWRLYYYRAGRIFAEAIASSTKPSRTSRSTTDIHLIIIVGVVTTALGYEITITFPTDHAPPAWIVPILLGPAIFVVGRARLEKAVFNRISPARYVTLAVLAGALVLLVSAPPIVASAASAAVLFAAAVADTRRARGKPPERANPPY